MSNARSVSLVGVGIAVLIGGTLHAQEVPLQAQRAAQVLQEEASTIVSWAYPTATFHNFDGCSWNARTDELGCAFTYVNMFGGEGSRLLGFSLDGNGFISRIRDGGGDGWFPPFTTLRSLKGLVELASADLERSSGEDDESKRQLLALLAKGPEPEQVLRFLLNVDIALQ
jgi:hypothetical protein